MEDKLTIGISTCGRPDSIKSCLEKIQENLLVTYPIIVLDSMPLEENLKQYNSYENLTTILKKQPVGPSEARKIIAENTKSDYLLYLDDDIEVRKGSIENLVDYMDENKKVMIVGGCWAEKGSYREIAQRFLFGKAGGQEVVWKYFITHDFVLKNNLSSVEAEAVLASMLVRTEVFEKVQFDPEYNFYYELFDFFMQCQRKGIVVEAIPNAVFDHKPDSYHVKNKRHAPVDKDKERFIRKWGVNPIGNLSLTTGKVGKLKQIYNRLNIS